MRITNAILIKTTTLFLCSWLSANCAALSDSDRLADIAERYYKAHAQLNPLDASYASGDAYYEDKLTITIAPAHRQQEHKLASRTLHQLAVINPQALPESDQVSLAMLTNELQTQLNSEQFPLELTPIDQYGGLPVDLAQLGSGQSVQPLKTPANYDHYLARLKKLPAWIDQAIANMRRGIKLGVVQPRPLIEHGLPAIKALTETDLEKSTYFLAIKNLPPEFSAKDKARLTAEYTQLIQQKLLPASNKLYRFLTDEYLPKTRTSAGLDALPQGESWYKFLVKYHTTTDMTPAEIHQLGLREVARIRTEMAKVQTKLGVKGTLTEFLQWQNTDPKFRPFNSEQEILDAYAALNQKIIPQLPHMFGRSPKAALEIRPEPELTRKTASDHYNPAAVDGSRPGVFYTVIDKPADYNITSMTSLFLHEGQPGHHYQIALQQELPLPKFRKYGWSTAFGEGWALYAETLGKEMGLYDDPIQYLGHLKLELVRAVRLVTDTGLHAQGWSRQQTIDYMMEAQGIDAQSAQRATERYMAWPGQALAYKIGALKIQALRARAQQQLGDKFNLSQFHDKVLSEGTIPLAILEKNIDAWISQQQNQASLHTNTSLKLTQKN